MTHFRAAGRASFQPNFCVAADQPEELLPTAKLTFCAATDQPVALLPAAELSLHTADHQPHANSLKEILHDIFWNLHVQKNKVREQTYATQSPSRNLWCETIKVQKRYMNILFPYLFNFILDHS